MTGVHIHIGCTSRVQTDTYSYQAGRLSAIAYGVSHLNFVIAICNYHSDCWRMCRFRINSGIFDHMSLHIHMKCAVSTQFFSHTIASKLATMLQKTTDRSEQSSYCFAHDLYPVQPAEGCAILVEKEVVAVRALFFFRIQFHADAKANEGLCRSERCAYVQRIPAQYWFLHGHEVHQFLKADLSDSDYSTHFLMPLSCIARPLILDRSCSDTVTLIPFQGKGLVDVADADPEPDPDLETGEHDLNDCFT